MQRAVMQRAVMHRETPFGEKILCNLFISESRLLWNHCEPELSFVRNFRRLNREYGMESPRCQRNEDSNFDTTHGKLLKCWRGRGRRSGAKCGNIPKERRCWLRKRIPGSLA